MIIVAIDYCRQREFGTVQRFVQQSRRFGLPCTAMRKMSIRGGILLAVLLIASGCLESEGRSDVSQCANGLVEVFVTDGESYDPEYGYLGEWTCMTPDEKTSHYRVQDAKANADNDYRNYNATMEAERDEMYRREAEEAEEDAIRSCILAGNQAELCQLNPYDPYGVEEQR